MRATRADLLRALSDAERTVVSLAITGVSNVDIARARRRSVRTVANQLGAAYRKLGLSGRRELRARVGDAEEPAAYRRFRLRSLSARELDVLDRVTRGLSNKAIAIELELSLSSVSCYVMRARSKERRR